MSKFGWGRRYVAHRKRRTGLVYAVVEECGAGLGSLRGSWHYGDFHLALDGARSFSDLDLVLVGASREEISLMGEAIEHRLASSLKLKVAIHPTESMMGMTLEDAKLLLVGEYLISTFRKVPDGYMTLDYVRAKIALLFLRTSREERYEAVLRRLDSELVTRAGMVKFGSRSEFSVVNMAQCLGGELNEVVAGFVRECLVGRPSSGFLEEWKQKVQEAPSVGRWLKNLVITRVSEAMAR